MHQFNQVVEFEVSRSPTPVRFFIPADFFNEVVAGEEGVDIELVVNGQRIAYKAVPDPETEAVDIFLEPGEEPEGDLPLWMMYVPKDEP